MGGGTGGAGGAIAPPTHYGHFMENLSQNSRGYIFH